MRCDGKMIREVCIAIVRYWCRCIGHRNGAQMYQIPACDQNQHEKNHKWKWMSDNHRRARHQGMRHLTRRWQDDKLHRKDNDDKDDGHNDNRISNRNNSNSRDNSNERRAVSQRT